MAVIHIKEHEPFDVALRRFKRACEKAGILTRLRQLESYEKPTSERKRKRSAAIKREQKRVMKDRGIFIPRKEPKRSYNR
jgi:small subunit ribosomal protein S21